MLSVEYDLCQCDCQDSEVEADCCFVTVGNVELSVPGGLNAKGEGEIVLRVIPPAHGMGRKTDKTVDEVNDDLFG